MAGRVGRRGWFVDPPAPLPAPAPPPRNGKGVATYNGKYTAASLLPWVVRAPPPSCVAPLSRISVDRVDCFVALEAAGGGMNMSEEQFREQQQVLLGGESGGWTRLSMFRGGGGNGKNGENGCKRRAGGFLEVFGGAETRQEGEEGYEG